MPQIICKCYLQEWFGFKERVQAQQILLSRAKELFPMGEFVLIEVPSSDSVLRTLTKDTELYCFRKEDEEKAREVLKWLPK